MLHGYIKVIYYQLYHLSPIKNKIIILFIMVLDVLMLLDIVLSEAVECR